MVETWRPISLASLLGGHWSAGVEQRNHLVNNRVAHQPTKTRLTVAFLVHPGRVRRNPYCCQAHFDVSRILETSK
jgi:hypothetical protein